MIKQFVSPAVTVTVDEPAITTLLMGSNGVVLVGSRIVAVNMSSVIKPVLSVTETELRIVTADAGPYWVKFWISKNRSAGTVIVNDVPACRI